MNYQEIRQAVLSGKTVFWKTSNYTTTYMGVDEWIIYDSCNKRWMPLTWSDGTTLIYDESSFYIKGSEDERFRDYIEDLATEVDSVATSLHPEMIRDCTVENARETLRAIANTMRKAADREV